MTTTITRPAFQITDDPKAAEIGSTLLSRSYSTRERLEAAKPYATIRGLRHLILQLPSTRWTAVIVDNDWQRALTSGFAILG